MGLTPLLIATLFCLLVCPGNFTHGCNVTLEEIIKTLNTLSGKKTTCMEVMVADVFAVPKNTTEKEILCTATTVLRQTYQDHPVSRCLNKNGKLDILKLLRGLYRNLRSMAQLHNCPVSESKQRTLKDFLESLKNTMQKKYSQCGRSKF
ncbi:interleukin-4 [Marmota monax]|uniref:interleukin-4 n=1 Tax=Marmota flaviventris TaxID=93162 RepID=UPI000FFF7A04|nr:interleukin-4 [Marmota flaviventris]XP_046323597.1 interleukin-4 [Marmota monax]KAI6049415.1 IL4 [Marmota monax]KAI6059602.1 IL4 [Marmota monax]